MKYWLIPLVAFGLAAQDHPPKLKIQTTELPNGLKLVMSEDHSRPVINLQVWYHVGSKDERTGRTGFAHLFEHLMFRGSKNVGPEEHMKYVREAGGVVNAYTTFDQTVYWESFPSNYLERMLWLEADRMSSLVINQENFQKEREVVKEERRLRFENPPYGMISDELWGMEFKEYPYKHAPIGSMEDLNKATPADVQEFFNTYYVPNNATVVIVGDFDGPDAVAWAKKYFGQVPKSKNPVPRVTATEPAQTELREFTKNYANIPLPAVLNLYHLPPMGNPDSYALDITSRILSSGQSSRLYKRLVYDEQAAVQASGQSFFLEGPSLFFGIAIANQGKNIKEVGSSMAYVFEQVRKEPVTNEELTKAKNQTVATFITGAQTMQQKADNLGRMAVLQGNPELVNTELDKYQKVTAADVQKVAQKYLVDTNETRIWVYPEQGKK
ncbi:MAG TPA: pitrilysin family protein [Bryobacteraceae bacterium]|nr:pitrilysin family protein [Bryobacteraceae bacterium]